MSKATDRLPPVLRDLEWAVSSPSPLLPNRPDMMLWQEPDQRLAAWLCAQQGNVDLITHLLDWRQRRLGQYFERLWLAWLQDHPDWLLRLAHFPVRDSQRTLGEIDVILEERATGKLVHLELAVKFYLRVPLSGGGDDAQWVGPGLQDSLDRKYRHLTGQQLPLGRHPQVTRHLGRPVDEHRILLRGRFFAPPGDTPVFGMTSRSQAGPGWLTLSDCRRLPSLSRLQSLSRSQWLTGPAACQWQHRERWVEANSRPLRPVMVWLDLPDHDNPHWLMVVPDDWPDRARAFCHRESTARGDLPHGR